MDPGWTTIKYVTSGLTLAAFLALVVYYALRAVLKKDQNLIESAPAKDRGKLAAQALEKLHIDTQGLPPEKLYDLALEQLRERRRRLRILLVSGLTVFIVGMATLVISWKLPR